MQIRIRALAPALTAQISDTVHGEFQPQYAQQQEPRRRHRHQRHLIRVQAPQFLEQFDHGRHVLYTPDNMHPQ